MPLFPIMPRHEARKRDAVANELESFKAKQEDSGPPKVNLGDGASLKRALDEAAATVLFDPIHLIGCL